LFFSFSSSSSSSSYDDDDNEKKIIVNKHLALRNASDVKAACK